MQSAIPPLLWEKQFELLERSMKLKKRVVGLGCLILFPDQSPSAGQGLIR